MAQQAIRLQPYSQRTAPGAMPDSRQLQAPVEYTSVAASPGWQNLARGLDGLAAGLQARDNALADFRAKQEEENGRAYAAAEIANARLQWHGELNTRHQNMVPGSAGSADLAETFIKDFDKYAQESIQRAPTPAARRFLESRILDLGADLGIRAFDLQNAATVDFQEDLYKRGIDNVKKLMNTDPAQYSVALAEQLAVIDASALPPVRRSALRERLVNEVSSAAVWTQIQRSPTQFLNSIGFGAPGRTRAGGNLQGETGNAAFDAMPFERRTQMLESAIKLKAQIDVDANRAAEAERKRLAEDAMKEAWARVYSPKGNALRRDYIESIRPLISDNEYKSLHEAIKPKGDGPAGGRTDPAAFRDLQKMIEENPREAARLAFTLHQNGRLSNSDLSAALGRTNERSRQTGPRTEYERSRSFIVQSMDPGPAVQDPAGRGRMAEALDTYDRWIAAGPGGKRTDDEISKYSKELVNRFKLVNFSETSLGLPMPRSGTIPRSGDPVATNQAIMKAAQEAQRRLGAKQMTQQEYDTEMAILNRWRKAAEGARPAP
jgi:hypothetical protein